MKVQGQPPLHLTYGLNVHPTETWPELQAAVFERAAAVKARVAPDRPFGLGLRIGRAVAGSLNDLELRTAFRRRIEAAGMYVFTINGFPYGRFHGARVKEQVYTPDWRTPERLAYTLYLAGLLADLLPEGVSGSISTLPVSYRSGISDPSDLDPAVRHLAQVATHLDRLGQQRGRDIHLGLEPEPGCVLEKSDEFFAFLRDRLWPRLPESARSRLGLCLDVCHALVAYENPADILRRCHKEGVRVSKIQISAALEATPEGLAALKEFNEPVYLHQTSARGRDGHVESWRDLPDALTAWRDRPDFKSARVHFHVPMHFEGRPGLRSTAFLLDRDFFAAVRNGATEHLEIETYSLPVMPGASHRDPSDSIAAEYEWVLDRLV